MNRQKPLKCRGCGKMVGTVTIKPKFQRKLLYWSLATIFAFEFISNLITTLIIGGFK